MSQPTISEHADDAAIAGWIERRLSTALEQAEAVLQSPFPVVQPCSILELLVTFRSTGAGSQFARRMTGSFLTPPAIQAGFAFAGTCGRAGGGDIDQD
jgi:hypothetical protein